MNDVTVTKFSKKCKKMKFKKRKKKVLTFFCWQLQPLLIFLKIRLRRRKEKSWRLSNLFVLFCWRRYLDIKTFISNSENIVVVVIISATKLRRYVICYESSRNVNGTVEALPINLICHKVITSRGFYFEDFLGQQFYLNFNYQIWGKETIFSNRLEHLIVKKFVLKRYTLIHCHSYM